MKLIVNGEEAEHHGDGRIRSLLEEQGAIPGRTAVMVNGEVVPRDKWPAVVLAEGDRVELLVFVGGG